MNKNALIIVDVQIDFCEGGLLAVKGGNAIVAIINKIIDKFDIVIASKDWHPKDTIHFNIWPKHCIQNTVGAQLHKDLKQENINLILLKGTLNKDDGYSAFDASNINLKEYLLSNNIKNIYICGIATEYCVKSTALDSLSNGYNTYVITDACAAVNLKHNDHNISLQQMKEKGCILIKSNQINN